MPLNPSTGPSDADTTRLPADSTTQTATLLCVDDEANILSALRRLFRPDGYRVLLADSGAAGLQILETEAVDLIISDMRMPQMNGSEFLGEVRKRWPDTIRILLTGHADIDSTIAAINQGEIYRYVSKPWNDTDVRLIVRHALERKHLEHEKARLEKLTQQQNLELQDLNANLELKVRQRTEELNRAHDELASANEKLKVNFLTSIKIFSNLIELSEKSKAGHSRRVAELARRIANQMGLERSEALDIMIAGLLHDIGKIGLSDSIIGKPVSQMTQEEKTLYRNHALRGETVLLALDSLQAAARLIRSHHERFDGLGYPDELSGEIIPLGARILAVANDYDALQIGTLTGKRLSPVEARRCIVQAQGKRYDPQVVAVFSSIIGASERDTPQPCAELAVPAGSLAPGMVLSRDLLMQDGVLLLTADFCLDSYFVKQLAELARHERLPLIVHIRQDHD